MLRRDTTGEFSQSGFWIFKQYRFAAGGAEPSRPLSQAAYRRLEASQAETPALVGFDAGRRRRWWWFRDDFYWEDDGYEPAEVKALVLERLSQRERRVKRAVALMEQGETSVEAARAAIPDDIKAFVWNRDGGRCVRCGSQERLEFDHVIPVSLGGSSTARNLQVLCEACNRGKGASIA